LRKSGLASLVIFYYDFREEQKTNLRGLLSSVLVQLCRQFDSYCDVISKLYSDHDDGEERPSDDALLRCFKRLLELPRQAPIFLIVDALDECSNEPESFSRKKVLKLLEDLIKLRLPNLHLCVTSRPEVDIKAVLEPLTFKSISLEDEHGQKEDIKNYIKSVVDGHENMRNWNAEYKQLVIDVLTERADGM
jgi:hypothetical protein